VALGDAHAALGARGAALTAWEQAAQADPGGVHGAHLKLAAFGAAPAPASAPGEYVRVKA
jgi:predicted TPR repeat methyltransferase